MIYLENFQFPDEERETDFFYRPDDARLKRTCYDTYYPFQILSKKHFRRVDFEPVTVFYGGNGCGKTTALNVIAAKLGLERDTPYNRSEFFEDYLRLCDAEVIGRIPKNSRIITSDDVFDYMLNIRSLNNGVELRREELFEEYLEMKYSNFRMRSMDDYDTLKKVNLARSKTQSKYVRANTPGTASKSSTANCTLKISTSIPRNSCTAGPTNAAIPTIFRFVGFFTIRPARYTPMVTVINFSSSPSPPNCPSIISLNTSSPVAAPRAAESGSNSIPSTSGIKRKYSTENSTMPI